MSISPVNEQIHNACRRLFLLVLLFLQISLTYANEPNLIAAVKNGDYEKIVSIIKQEADLNVRDTEGAAAMHWAVRRDNLQVVEQLIQAGADVNSANPYGVTPLWLACTNRNSAIIELLLTARADPKAVLGTGESVLMNCVRTGTTKAVETLIKYDADVNSRESAKGQTALMWSAAGNYPDITKILIDNGAEIAATSNSGFTALLFAARSGDMESARILVKVGADPNEATVEHGNALLIASASGHDELALFLIAVGADINAEDINGLTPLHHAVRGGLALLNGVIYDAAYRTRPSNSLPLATALLDSGANPNKQIKKSVLLGPDGAPFIMEGSTPFLLAAASADIPMMDLLLKFGADPGLVSVEKITPLIAAAQAACTGTCAYQGGGNVARKQDVEKALMAVKNLVEAGADVNQSDIRGRTAMHVAAFTGADPVVQYLADHGAEVNVKNIYNETPWSMASGMSPLLENTGLYGKHDSTAALLLKLGARPIPYEEIINPYAPVSGAGTPNKTSP